MKDLFAHLAHNFTLTPVLRQGSKVAHQLLLAEVLSGSDTCGKSDFLRGEGRGTAPISIHRFLGVMDPLIMPPEFANVSMSPQNDGAKVALDVPLRTWKEGAEFPEVGVRKRRRFLHPGLDSGLHLSGDLVFGGIKGGGLSGFPFSMTMELDN